MNVTDEAPVDLAAVQADDALLDMDRFPLDQCSECGRQRWYVFGVGVASDGNKCSHPVGPGVDLNIALACALRAWRRDIDSEPIGVLVGTDKAVRLVRSVRKNFVGRVVDTFLRLLGVQR